MKPFKSLILPEKPEIVAYISVAFALLFAQSVRRFWVYIGGASAPAVSNTKGLDTLLSDWYLKFEGSIDPRYADFFIWMLVGCVVFALFNYTAAAIKSASDEADMLRYYHSPKGRLQEANAFITKMALRIAGVMGMTLWAVIFLKQINPTLTKLFFTSVTTPTDPISWLWIVLTIIGFATCLYVFTILARIIALKPRVFGER